MSRASLRNLSLGRLIQNQTTTRFPDPINTIHPVLRSQTTRHYFQVSHFLKRGREYEVPFSLFSATFSSSSSAATIPKTGLIGWYLGMVKSRPILTKSITCSLIYIAADLSSQTISKLNSEPYDLVRTMRMAGYGLLILGPSLHFWFNFMSRLFPQRNLMSTLKKMALGQTTYGPALTVVFFSLNARLQGESGTEIIARLKRDLLPTLLSGAMYWPVCDFITFSFVPVHLQPLVSNSFSYLWTIYMTYMASLEKAGTAITT